MQLFGHTNYLEIKTKFEAKGIFKMPLKHTQLFGCLRYSIPQYTKCNPKHHIKCNV